MLAGWHGVMSSWLFIRMGDLKPGGGLPLLILNHSASVLCGRTRARFKTWKHTINKCFQEVFFLLLFLVVFNHLMFFQLFFSGRYKCICPVLSPPDGWMAIKLNNLTRCPLATLKKITCHGYMEVLYLEFFFFGLWEEEKIKWCTRWNESQICWVSFTYPYRKEPIENILKEENLEAV